MKIENRHCPHHERQNPAGQILVGVGVTPHLTVGAPARDSLLSHRRVCGQAVDSRRVLRVKQKAGREGVLSENRQRADSGE